ncbi:MAG: carboxypeptidase regulatory-like domain-containing protein [Bryobacteraceae bacterium]
MVTTSRAVFPLAVALLANAALAQITGDLKGVVIDPSNSPITGAKVTLKSLETSASRTADTDAEGRFAFNLLRLGPYEVKAESPNFRASSTNAEVKAGETTSLRFSLEVGQVTESVTVSDAVARVDVENAQLQTSILGEKVLDIPSGRNPNSFAVTAPGTAPVSANNPFLGSGSFNTNGGRGRGNNITIDGVPATDVSVTGTGGTLTPLIFQTIREVKVITNNFNAEYGRNANSQVIYLTESPTNALRGELWDYFQNDKLNSRPFFDRTGKTNILRYNAYGFKIGGPVLIPKLFDGRNKVFWYAAYEGQKQRGAGQARIARVPTPAQLAGITDPTSKALADVYKLPSDPSGQIQTSAPNKQDVWKLNLKGELNLGTHDQISVRYAEADSFVASTGNTFVGGNLLGFGAFSSNHPYQATAQETHTFGASAVNEFRFGFLESVAGFPIDTPYPLGPRVRITAGDVASFGVWEGLPQGRSQDSYQFTDNFSLIHGRHGFKFGGEYYTLLADSVFDSFQRPTLDFANFADFAAGRPNGFSQRFGNSVRENRVKNFYTFFQDDWKVSRGLTINLGLRLEWAGGPTEKQGLISNLNLDNRSAFGAAGAGRFGLLEVGKPSFNSNWNWGPRIGFAWSPGGNQKTAIRGGYGMAYDFVFLNPITNQRFLPPFIVSATLTGIPSFAGDNSFARIVAGTAQVQANTKSQVGALSATTLNFGAISPAIAQNLRNAQAQQWSLGVQREIFNGWVASAAYVGTKGTYLPRSRDLNLIASPVTPARSLEDETARLTEFQTANQGLSGNLTAFSNRIDPRYNGIAYNESSANSNFHSGQFEVTRRFGSYYLRANYTIGKSIDDNSDVLGVLINDSSNQQNPLNNKDNRAASQFDLRQRAVITHDWKMPFFKNSSSRFVRTVVAGWGFSGVTSFRSGFPVTLDAGPRRGINPISVLGGGAQIRPNVTGPVNFQPKPAGSAGSPQGASGAAGLAVSNYAASLGLSQPLLGNFGNMGRNVLRLNGERNFDWSMHKSFRISEGMQVRFLTEFYNIFNNTSFQDVDRNLANPTFGQYTTVAQNPRQIQMALRFLF